MRSELGCSSVSLRVTSVCVGVMTAILWLLYVYVITIEIVPIGREDDTIVIFRVPLITALICAVSSSLFSVLMISGAVKRKPNLMFPWLAIHFVLLMVGVATACSFLLVLIFTDTTKIFISLSISLMVISILLYLWSVVYVHYKRLSTGTQAVTATCLNEGKILKVPNEPENPYQPI